LKDLEEERINQEHLLIKMHNYMEFIYKLQGFLESSRNPREFGLPLSIEACVVRKER
jgi:hypothetical protein